MDCGFAGNLGHLSGCFPLHPRKSLLTSADVPAVKVSYTFPKRTLKRNGSIFIPEFSNQEMETTQE